ATHVQLDELKYYRRAKTREAYGGLPGACPGTLLTESTVWDVSVWGGAKWPSTDTTIEQMHARLLELDGREKRFPNQFRDILIAETAIKNGLTLISDDGNLRRVTNEYGGKAMKPWRHR